MARQFSLQEAGLIFDRGGCVVLQEKKFYVTFRKGILRSGPAVGPVSAPHTA